MKDEDNGLFRNDGKPLTLEQFQQHNASFFCACGSCLAYIKTAGPGEYVYADVELPGGHPAVFRLVRAPKVVF